MTENLTRTSVIMPVLNGRLYIRAALDSALLQLTPTDEIIVVDNGSSDCSMEVVASIKDERLRIFDEKIRGAAAARNTALRHATGNYIAFLDCDDLWPPGRQQGLLAVLRKNVAIGAAYGRFRLLFEHNIDPNIVHLDGVLSPIVCLNNFLFRKSVIDQIGYMDETLLAGEDTDYLLRLQESAIEIAPYDGDATIYRRHAANTTLRNETITGGVMGVLARRISRRRGNCP